MDSSATERHGLLVLDRETPWIASLIDELPTPWTAEKVGPRRCGLNPRAWHVAHAAGFVPVPSWSCAFTISSRLLARAVRRQITKAGRPRTLVHTIPWTAGLLPLLPDVAHVYRPHDYFGMYNWNQKRVNDLESQLMTACRVVAPISERQAGDLRPLGRAPMVTIHNGVSGDFVKRLREPTALRPDDLPADGKPIIGCIGQINSSYDWDLVENVILRLDQAWFVLIGPKFNEAQAIRRRIEKVLSHQNVRWLGSKPHEQLPDYLRHFDICFSPLKVSAANDRRSLLRLYDYLASGKIVISTAIESAKLHHPHVLRAETAPQLIQLFQEALAGRHAVDATVRQRYVDQQTWECRAVQFTKLVEQYCPLEVN